jgi:hypothetical protein
MGVVKKILPVALFAVILLFNLNPKRPKQKKEGKLSLDNLIEMAQAEGEDSTEGRPAGSPIQWPPSMN